MATKTVSTLCEIGGIKATGTGDTCVIMAWKNPVEGVDDCGGFDVEACAVEVDCCEVMEDGDKFWRMPECYIRGSTIKYLRIPDEVIDMVKEETIVKSRGRGEMKGRGGGQARGRGVGREILLSFGLNPMDVAQAHSEDYQLRNIPQAKGRKGKPLVPSEPGQSPRGQLYFKPMSFRNQPSATLTS
uniref:U6 snRNA-associated Sm-like protein LSm4 n=1 Tax=Timema shepardi TaxID=629360 RepID=A0A7R9FWY9_TIMSH|nr:unnamed protein product [Timema shepardi]